jgi:hypothetical protein
MGLLDGLSDYANAIAKVESGGRYDILGPVIPKSGDRAYGKYQVMGANIPEWTRAALGKELSPGEFLANPEAQDAVFNHRFGSYVEKYGNPQDAASVWFSGRPMAKAGNSSDGYNTVPQYIAKFNAALGQPQQQRIPVTASPMQAQAKGGPIQAPSPQAQTAELPPMFAAPAVTPVPAQQPQAPQNYFDLLAATLAEQQQPVKPIKFAGMPARRGFY